MTQQKTRTNRRRRRRKRSNAGLLFLELIAIVAFTSLLMFSKNSRRSASPHPNQPPAPTVNVQHNNQTFAMTQTTNAQPTQAWKGHRPRFSRAIGDIWNGGF